MPTNNKRKADSPPSAARRRNGYRPRPQPPSPAVAEGIVLHLHRLHEGRRVGNRNLEPPTPDDSDDEEPVIGSGTAVVGVWAPREKRQGIRITL